MRQLITLVCIVISFFACKKNKINGDEVTYEVILGNSSSWHGAYLNEKGLIVSVSDAPTGWKYSFQNTNNLVVLTLDAYADGLQPNNDASMKIYVNGFVVATGKSSSFPQVQYIFP